MAGKQIDDFAATITDADSHGWVTVDDVSGFYEKAIVWLNDSGAVEANIKRCVIMEVDADNSKLALLFRSDAPGEAPQYGRSDVSSYNGGTVTQNAQFIYNSDDAPLS